MRVSRSVRCAVIGVALVLVGPAGPARAAPGAEVRYSFDGPALLADVSGHGHDLSPVARNGGSFTTVAHGTGRAVAFPPPCTAEPCPRIALRAETAGDLNPGSRSLRYGAAVRLAANETDKGENVLQKGFSTQGSQFKLQIDGVAGHPSCVLVGDRSPQIYLAASTVGVADDKWHTLECHRAGARLAIRVDGVRRGLTVIPAALAVSNTIPVSVGGKGSFADNDQFQGMLDDVWVKIGASPATPATTRTATPAATRTATPATTRTATPAATRTATPAATRTASTPPRPS